MGDTRTIRRELAAALDQLLNVDDDQVVDVVAFGTVLAVDARPALMVVLDTVEPLPNMPHGTRRHAFTLWLVHPQAEPGAADDALDALLGDLLDLLDGLPGLRFADAQRGRYGDAHPAYQLHVTREE